MVRNNVVECFRIWVSLYSFIYQNFLLISALDLLKIFCSVKIVVGSIIMEQAGRDGVRRSGVRPVKKTYILSLNT